MTASVESAQAHQSAEYKGKIVVEIQHTVFRADKGSGDPYEKAAVYMIEKL